MKKNPKQTSAQISGTITFCFEKAGYYHFRVDASKWILVPKNFLPAVEDSLSVAPLVYAGMTINCPEVELQKNMVYVAKKPPMFSSKYKGTLSETLEFFLKKTKKLKLLKILRESPKIRKHYLTNPWQLYFDDKIDFFTMLSISFASGMYPKPQNLIKGAIKHYANFIYERSKSYEGRRNVSDNTPLKAFISLIRSFMKALNEPATDQEILEICKNNEYVVIENENVYPTKVYDYKKICIDKISSKNKSSAVYESIEDALSENSIIALTGDAGTGKSTLATQAAKELQAKGYKTTLTAMTGKATCRFTNDIQAQTLHKWLGYKNGEYTNWDATYCLVIDESSMLTWELFGEVLRREPEKIILCGDPKQLPPVFGENTFKSLLQILPKVSLSKVYRGKMHVNVIKTLTPTQVYDAIVNVCRKLLQENKQFQVLSSRYNGSFGIINLNKQLKTTVYHNHDERVIVKKNYYEQNTLIAPNGQTGVVLSRNQKDVIFKPDGSNSTVLIPQSYLTDAYAISVHKAQGSEWDYVVYVKHPGDTQEIVKVATTRARVKTFVIDLLFSSLS